ncbi:MAG: YqgE/AlgH family protein [Sphingobacteriaceae bacterium]
MTLINAPKQGSLLISEPFMLDPNFKRSVVLLTEYGEEGAVGYILNQKSDLLLKDLILDCWEANFPIYLGGPVANDTLHFIHCAYDRLGSGEWVADNLYWGGDFETLKLLINSNQIQPEEIKFFVGYSGWEPEQLEQEIEQKAWISSNQYRKGLAFENEVDELWKEVVVSLGPKFAHLAKFPENPMWN